MATGSNGQDHDGGSRRAAHESLLYGSLSRVYDAVFARVFLPRVAFVIRALDLQAGTRVLEIGAGTGGSLPAYPPDCDVTALDLSAQMLRRAQHKIERMGWKHIRLVEGNATRLPFPDDAFDVVGAFHMVTVVDDPDRMMREVVRVCRPHGRVAIVNRFRSEVPALDRLEQSLEPMTRGWGWGTLRREEVLEGQPLRVLDARHGGPLGLFTAVVAENTKPGRAAASARGQDEADA